MRRRKGFTLIEMLVAMTLTIFLMVIIVQCFVTSLQTFRDLKAAGDLEASLRTASTIMRRDLAADHFEGKRRLSDPQLWTYYAPNNPGLSLTQKTQPSGPPREGFFCLYQGSDAHGTPGVGYYVEGADADGFPSYRVTMDQPDPKNPPTPNQILHFTVKLRGNQQPNFFSAKIGGAMPSPLFTLGHPDSRFQDSQVDPRTGATTSRTYNSPWAEVAYFLSPNGQSANGTPLFALYRRQRLAVSNQPPGIMPPPAGVTPALPASVTAEALNWDPRFPVPAATLPFYQQISCWANGARLYFNSPADLAIPTRRFGQYNPYKYLPLGTGDDLLLANVVSFEVNVLFAVNGVPRDSYSNLYESFIVTNGNYRPPGDVGTGARNPAFSGSGPRVLDTWSTIKDDTDGSNYSAWFKSGSNASMPILFDPARGIGVAAISVTLRIWDLRTEQTRQITFIQDM